MKTRIATLMFLGLSSPIAFALSEPSVHQVVETYNSFYPTLQLSVATSADHDALLEELEILGESLNGENVPAGELVHLACSAPAW